MSTASNQAFELFKNYALYFVLLILLAVIVSKDTSFLSLTNFSNILTQSSVRVIIALGVAGLIVTQGTDLSVGRKVGLAAVVSATLLQATDNVNKVFPNLGEVPIPLVILLVAAIGAVIGLVNGIIVTVLNVTPFIATLGTMLIIYGINSLYYDHVGSAPIAGFTESYSQFTQGFFRLGGFRLSYITVYALVAIVLMWVIWNKTRFGKNLFAIGGSATNNLGFMYEMDAIAACVIGGVSFSGGVGTVIGVVMGVVIFTLINYGLSYIGVSPYWQYIIKGAIIVMAVAIDSLKHAKKK